MVATTLANTVAWISPLMMWRPYTMPSTPKETTVEITDTIVYRITFLASGVCRLSQRCSTRTIVPLIARTLAVINP